MSQSRESKNALEPALQREILEAVENLDFGSVEVTVHQGRVVSIEVRAKRRFDAVRKDTVVDRA
jgi:hypothetical protein